MSQFRPLWGFTAFMLTFFIGCIFLGGWQLQRLQWKLNLIRQAEENLKAPPISIDKALAADIRGAQYRRVRITGRFDHSREAYVFSTAANGVPVYHVITPIVFGSSKRLLVDRGLVPAGLRERFSRSVGDTEGVRDLTGVWRIPDAPGIFTPTPNYARRIWYARDVLDIARLDGIKLVEPVIIELDATPNRGVWPKGGQTIVTFRNDHLQYAITWFAIAAVILVGWLVLHFSRGRIRVS